MSSVAEAFEDHRDAIRGPDRDWLRSAHLAREATIVKVNRARVVLSKGEALVAECQAVVDQLDRETDDASQRESERIAAGIRGDAPQVQEEDHSAAGRLRRRSDAAMALATAERARDQLRIELETAEGELRATTLDVEAAAADLLLRIGEELAAETVAAEAIARDLRHRLSALSRLWISNNSIGRPQAIKLGRNTLRVLGALPLNDLRVGYPAAHDPTGPSLERWQRVAVRLLQDAEAPLE